MRTRFRRLYGADPLHLLALLASFAVSAAAIVRWFDFSGPDTIRVLAWFLGAIVIHDLVLFPLYTLLDRLALGRLHEGAAPARRRGAAYVRVPALLSGLLLLVFYPEIFRLGAGTFRIASGQSQDPYLVRWLLASAALFGGSAIAWALAVARDRREALTARVAPAVAILAEPDLVEDEADDRDQPDRGEADSHGDAGNTAEDARADDSDDQDRRRDAEADDRAPRAHPE